MEKEIILTIKGKIHNFQNFKESTTKQIESTKADPKTSLYWRTHTADCKGYCDVSHFIDSEAALTHLSEWTKALEDMKDTATIEKVMIIGSPSDELKKATEPFKTKLLKLYSGFSK